MSYFPAGDPSQAIRESEPIPCGCQPATGPPIGVPMHPKDTAAYPVAQLAGERAERRVPLPGRVTDRMLIAWQQNLQAVLNDPSPFGLE